MAVQRFLPDVERTRRAVGLVFVALGLLAIAAVGWLAIGADRITVTTVVLIALPAALAASGLHLALRPPVVVEVDLGNRTFAVIRKGTRSGSGPLDTLGPLTVTQRTRLTGSSDKRSTVIEYIVEPAADPQIDFFVMDTPGKARQKMEKLAHAWHLPCQSYGGEVRAADDLNKPFHERIRIDRQALAATPLSPEWGLRVEPLSAGYALVSTYRSWAPLKQGVFILLPTLFVLGSGSRSGILTTFRETGGDLLERILAGLLGIVVLVLLWKLWEGARDTFFPGTVRVTERGVSYRGRRMAFDQIEEVTTNVPIEIVGDRRILPLAVSFCPPAATEAVAHELKRLILEVAPRGRLGI